MFFISTMLSYTVLPGPAPGPVRDLVRVSTHHGTRRSGKTWGALEGQSTRTESGPTGGDGTGGGGGRGSDRRLLTEYPSGPLGPTKPTGPAGPLGPWWGKTQRCHGY